MMNLCKTYEAVLDLQADLRSRVGAMAAADITIPCHLGPLYDYKLIKALSATYELQEYLAGAIADAVTSGRIEPEMDD